MLYPQRNASRELMCLDGCWRFFADKNNEISTAFINGLTESIPMAVPGSWNEQYTELFDFHGKGWYETHTSIPKHWENQRVFLRLGAVTGKAAAWINGQPVLEHEGSALPIEADVSAFVKYGEENTIVVLADSTLDPWGLPPAQIEEKEARDGFYKSYPAVNYDFYPYGGIQRSVYLYTTEKEYIRDIIITTPTTDGTVHYRIEFSAAVNGTLSVEIDGQEKQYRLLGQESVEDSIVVQNPKLWEIGQPNLYQLHAELTCNGKTDRYQERFGIRTVCVQGDAFLLNDKPVFFRGFGKHEDFHIIGKGFSHAVAIKDFSLLKWIGANSFRTSHYPYDESMLQYADEMGIMVIAETPFVGLCDRMYRQDILDKANVVIEEMIARDKNHPSVVMWSLANEPGIGADEEHRVKAEYFFREMQKTARRMDGTRPLTYVACEEPENNTPFQFFDVVCINKYYGWYIGSGRIEGTLKNLDACLERFRNTFGKPMIITEFGADAIDGIHHDPPLMYSEEFQEKMIVEQYQLFCSKPYIIGTHVWAFADFQTTQTTARPLLNRKGIFTRDRQPKMAAHALRKVWNKEN
ncbi:MAG: beta-glucuronidase [Lachnospiraceae bacterium]|nr:beta-glucuronidase [Lachnospiraceae bacterium]